MASLKECSPWSAASLSNGSIKDWKSGIAMLARLARLSADGRGHRPPEETGASAVPYP